MPALRRRASSLERRVGAEVLLPIFALSAGKRNDVAWSTRTLLGCLFLGWGLFNLIEGIIDHELLGLHHVHPGPGQEAWDIAFLALAACQIGVGWLLTWLGRGDSTPRGSGTRL